MNQFLDNQRIFTITAKPVLAFTVNATTDIVTANGHGLANGDMITVASATTLPAGLAASTPYYVINATTNTFQLTTIKDGVTPVNFTDTGAGVHTYTLRGKTILAEGFDHAIVTVATSGSATFTLKFQVSHQAESPEFFKAQSATNMYEYTEVIDYEDGASIAGDTGLAPAGVDDYRTLEFNINGAKYLSANLTAYTQGALQVDIKLYANC